MGLDGNNGLHRHVRSFVKTSNKRIRPSILGCWTVSLLVPRELPLAAPKGSRGTTPSDKTIDVPLVLAN